MAEELTGNREKAGDAEAHTGRPHFIGGVLLCAEFGLKPLSDAEYIQWRQQLETIKQANQVQNS